jgi:hypothetical protein
MTPRDFECTYELCGLWFSVYDTLSDCSLRCPACQNEVKQVNP